MAENDHEAEVGNDQQEQQQAQREDDHDREQDQRDGDDREQSLEYWRARARDQERRARRMSSAAKRLEEIEEAQKTEEQRTADKLAKLEERASRAEAEALRYKIAARYPDIDGEDADLFLTGTDEETLIKQAERLRARRSDDAQKRKNGWRTNEGRGSQQSGDPDLAFAQEFFGQR